LKVDDDHELRNLSLLSRVQDFLASFVSNDSRKSGKHPSHAWYICCSMMGVRNRKGTFCSTLTQSHHELVRTQTRGSTVAGGRLWRAANYAVSA
jgi:hypothetical protein